MPNDGTANGAPASATTVVGIGPPVVTSASIVETTPRTSDVLHASVTATDPDGDALTYSYQWTNSEGDGALSNEATAVAR
jgi:hypothetical protein